MKEPTFNGRELLPLSVMEAAHAGDAMAMKHRLEIKLIHSIIVALK